MLLLFGEAIPASDCLDKFVLVLMVVFHLFMRCFLDFLSSCFTVGSTTSDEVGLMVGQSITLNRSF